MKEGVIQEEIKLVNPKKTLQIDNYAMNIQNMNIYDNFDKLKELYKKEYEDRYDRVEKIIRSGNIDKDGWYKINRLFDGDKKSEFYTKDYMARDIIDYYKDLYGSNAMRAILNHDELKIKINNILEIVKTERKNNNKIWPPTSTAYDYNGFSQKTLEMIIRDDTLEKEIIKYKYLLGLISEDSESSKLFFHTTSK